LLEDAAAWVLSMLWLGLAWFARLMLTPITAVFGPWYRYNRWGGCCYCYHPLPVFSYVLRCSCLKSIGDLDMPTHTHAVAVLVCAADADAHHRSVWALVQIQQVGRCCCRLSVNTPV
jgi:hypothetical protein